MLSLFIKPNILIDETRRARLAGFGLDTIAWNTTDDSSPDSPIRGGTIRWMSPELIDPQRFGSEEARQTKSSDCYALGMVIYEIITGNYPFHQHREMVILMKVLNGERPPRTASFTDSLWKMLQRCWKARPDARPTIEDVLQCLEQEEALPPGPDVEMGGLAAASCKFPHFIPPQSLMVSAFKRIQR